MTSRFYVTTPIYYVNDVPHLGTAYSTIVADALRRYHLLRGEESRMLTGTDEHGLKLAQVASERGMEPQAFVDSMSARFREAWPKLAIAADDFIRTTEARHKAFVQELWKKIEANGDLYEGEYEDWYCVGCESFKTEKELLPGNLCPLHKKPVERLKERTYFFRLSKFQEPLLALYRDRPDFIEPQARRNEVISFVEGGLRDLSVSRTSFTWGIPVPDRPEHVMYVWFDALSNYRSALGSGDLARFWPPGGRVVHVVGKDILRFHAVYWPAFLLAAGYKLDELPTQVYAHGFLTVDGQKMSKTLRNAVDPLRIAGELGADVLRYHLLRAIAFGQDGDFDHAALLERYNADLGKNLGNLLNRVLGLCTKLTDGRTPALGEPSDLERELVESVEKAYAAASVEWEAIAPHRALELTWAVSSAANQYVDRAAPWAEAKKGAKTRVGTILGTLLEVLRAISVLIWPAMPQKSNELRAQLGLAPLTPQAGVDVWPFKFDPRPEGEALAPAEPLFPTFDKDAERVLLDKLVPKLEGEGAKAADTAGAAPTAGAKGGRDASSATTSPAVAETPSTPIQYDQFAAVDLRVGLVRTAERVPKKDKLLKLAVDVGEAEPRTIIAGLALSFAPEQLIGRRVVVVANLAPRDFGKGLVSHGMLLATGPSEALTLATVAGDVEPGMRLK
jgi:methionyl-tRNA synthetase